MKLTIELPRKVFDRLVALAINEYRHAPQQAAHIIERYLVDQDTREQLGKPTERPKEAVGVGK
jgi:hypothetical protein